MWTIYVYYIGKRNASQLMSGFTSIVEAANWLTSTYSPEADFWAGINGFCIK